MHQNVAESELTIVRDQLEQMVALRATSPFLPAEALRYERLCRRECELLAVQYGLELSASA